MSCYHPIAAYQRAPGEKPFLWPPLTPPNLALPCGKCIGCKTARATHWARRCQHEAKQYEHNTFITLTYADEKLPENRSVEPQRLQLFVKRLRTFQYRNRNRLLGDRSRGIRYFACGEYGSKGGRPHYHAILFNCGFPDGRRLSENEYESDTLQDLWADKGRLIGHCRFGIATPAAANYIAQYSMKKIGGETSTQVRPPFLRMSQKPPIGAAWLQRYKDDLQHGYLVTDGKRSSIPRAYTKTLERDEPELAAWIHERKRTYILSGHSDKNEPDRLAAQEVIHTQLKALTEKRKL